MTAAMSASYSSAVRPMTSTGAGLSNRYGQIHITSK